MARLASKSRQLYRRASRAIPGFRTIDGDEFLDYCMAYGALIDGHASPEVIRAVQKTAAKGSIFGQPTVAEVELAETISSLMPSMQMVRLVNSGTEATMHALRLARGFTGKKKILKFEGGFHGSHDSVLAKKGMRGSVTARPSSEGIPVETSKNTLVADYNDKETTAKIIRDHAGELAAVIVEPVAGNMGPIPPTRGFLESLRKLTRENNVVLIFDEVITGFRLSLGGAQEYFHIKPDLTILGKIVGGGFPLAAFGGKREIMRNLSPLGPVYQAGTYSGNPVSVTAGLTTLRSLKRRSNQVYPKLERLGRALSNGIRDLVQSQNISAQVNQVGSMFQIFFTPRHVVDYNSAKSSDSQKYDRYFRSLLKWKTFVPPSQLESCFLSTAHNDNELQETLDIVGMSLRSMGR